MELLTWRCARRTAAWDVIAGKGRRLECGEVFLTADGLVSEELFGHQEAVRRDTQLGVTMETSPAAALAMAQPEILLQVVVVALAT